jgi:plastocyanin
MLHWLSCGLGTFAALLCTCAAAATVDVRIVDSAGAPAANAVVSLMPDENGAAIAARTPRQSVIDQRHETFLPLVVIVRKGGRVIFTNNDTTMHQVYSFSPIKQFEFEIDRGRTSTPVVFDKAGVAAIGCNIHDNMVAFVYVADAPIAVITDEEGKARIEDVPEGAYHVAVWHPQLRIGRRPAPSALNVGAHAVSFSATLPLLQSAMPAMSHMHMSDY